MNHFHAVQDHFLFLPHKLLNSTEYYIIQIYIIHFQKYKGITHFP